MREHRPRRRRKRDTVERKEKTALCASLHEAHSSLGCVSRRDFGSIPCPADRQVQAEIQTEDREGDQTATISCPQGQGFVEKDSGLN